MSVAYPQPHGLWQIPPPATELLSCRISTLCRNPYGQALLRIREIRGCISSELTSVPPCQSILISKIYPPLVLNSSKSTAIRSIALGTPSARWTDLRNNQFIRHRGRLERPTSWMACPIPEPPLTHTLTPVLTSASPGSSKPTGLRTPQPSRKKIPPWESFTRLWLQEPTPLTPRPTTSPTWSN